MDAALKQVEAARQASAGHDAQMTRLRELAPDVVGCRQLAALEAAISFILPVETIFDL